MSLALKFLFLGAALNHVSSANRDEDSDGSPQRGHHTDKEVGAAEITRRWKETLASELLNCDGRLPRKRPLAAGPTRDEVIRGMKYALKQLGKFSFVDETPARRDECLRVFPLSVPSSTDAITFGNSVGVCVLASKEDSTETAVEYSEYNKLRNIPNFVAYKVNGLPALADSNTKCRSSWKGASLCPEKKFGQERDVLLAACHVLDFPFGPGTAGLVITPWPCLVADRACDAKIDSRGHMSPVASQAWSLAHCKGTMNFVNVFPSRNDLMTGQGFDRMQWAVREGHVGKWLKRMGRVEESEGVWLVTGTSRESDGTISTQRVLADEEPARVEVPSFVWTAVFDDMEKKATGWLCRNGLNRTDECYCSDRLSIRELEARVGHAIFPQLEGYPGLDMADGYFDEFWHNFQHEK